MFIYWRCEAKQHLALVGIVIFMLAVLLASYHITGKRGHAAEYAMTWERVDAQVVSSDIGETNTSDEYSVSTRLYVNARFGYQFKGEMIYGDYRGSWTRNDLRDWSELLKPGNRITIRVSPDDQTVVSLVDYNGTQ